MEFVNVLLVSTMKFLLVLVENVGKIRYISMESVYVLMVMNSLMGNVEKYLQLAK